MEICYPEIIFLSAINMLLTLSVKKRTSYNPINVFISRAEITSYDYYSNVQTEKNMV